MKKILLSLTIAFLGLAINANSQTIYSQNFSSASYPAMPTGWTNAVTGGGAGWQTTNAAYALALGTVPSVGADADFAYVDDYNNASTTPPGYNAPAYMSLGTAISLVGATTPMLSFDAFFDSSYDYRSGSTDTFEYAWVDASTDGTTWTTIASIPAEGAWYSQYVSLSAYAGTSTLYIRFGYTDHLCPNNGVAVANINVFNAQANDISLTAVTPVAGAANDYFTTGSSVTFAGTMLNLSPNTITSFSASYSVGGAAAVTGNFTGLSVAPFSSYNFSIPTTYSVASLGNQAVSMWVTEASDPVLSNDSMTTAINGVSFMPTKKLMFEECNGTWCGYCVRGIVYMDSLWTLDSNNVSIVSVHDYNGYDPMAQENTQTEDYDSYSQTFITGYPSIIIDRNVVDDPSNALVDYTAMNGNFGFANIAITEATYDTSGSGAINVSCSVTPAMNLSGDYRVELVLEENNVHDASNSGFAQHNYYSYQDLNEALSGSGYNFQDSLEVIPASSMYYHFVDRYTIPNLTTSTAVGVASSLPATMTAGTAYPYSFSTVTPTGTMAWVLSNMTAVVMLIDNNSGNVTYKQVLNSNNQKLANVLKVNNVSAGVDIVRLFPNPATDAAHLMFNLNNAGNVSFSIVDVTGKTVFSAPAEYMGTGGQQINFSTADLAAGTYNVLLATETGVVTQKLSVIK